MKLTGIRNITLGITLLAASVVGVHHCTQSRKQEEQRMRTEQLREKACISSERNRFYVTEGITLENIEKSRSIPQEDSLRREIANVFDTDNNKIFDKNEAKIFNATEVFKNPEKWDEIIFRTKMSDGKYSDSVTPKNELKNFKYEIDSKRVIDWLNYGKMKNSYTKCITNTKAPKIVTKGASTERNNKSFYTETGIETFEKNTSKYKQYWSDGLQKCESEYNYKDSTQVYSHFDYDFDKNGKLINKIMVKKYYEKRNVPIKDIVPFDCEGEDSCYRFERWENGAIVRAYLKDAAIDSLINEFIYKDNKLLRERHGQGFDANVIEYYPDEKIKYESYKTNIDGFGECIIRKFFGENGVLTKEVITTPEYYKVYNTEHIYNSDDFVNEPLEANETPFIIREYHPNGNLKKEVISECIDDHTYENDLYLVTTTEYNSEGKKISERKTDYGGYYRGG